MLPLGQVIQDGRIKEMDEPLYLLEEKADSAFAEMVRQLGPEEAQRLHEAAREKRYWTESKSGGEKDTEKEDGLKEDNSTEKEHLDVDTTGSVKGADSPSISDQSISRADSASRLLVDEKSNTNLNAPPSTSDVASETLSLAEEASTADVSDKLLEPTRDDQSSLQKTASSIAVPDMEEPDLEEHLADQPLLGNGDICASDVLSVI